MPQSNPPNRAGGTVENVEKSDDIRALWDNTRQNNIAIADLREVVGRLEVGQSSTQNQMTSEFQQVRELIKGNIPDRPNNVAMATLVVVILTAFGTVITSLNTQTTNSLQRETDMRFNHEADITNVLAEGLLNDRLATQKAIQEIHDRMAVDDIREQADAHKNGVSESQQEKMIADMGVLVAELNRQRSRDEDFKINLMARLSAVEVGIGGYTRKGLEELGRQQ